MNSNPNAAVGGGSAVGGGAIIIYILGLFHIHVDNYAAVAIAAAVSGVVLFIGREGLAGLVNTILHGNKPAAPPTTLQKKPPAA